jgi:O-methyltransferase domain/Dimerisation domain
MSTAAQGTSQPTAAGAPAITPEVIFDIASGFMAAKHLFVANEVGLFAGLAAGPVTLDELAGKTGITRSRLRVLADAMVTLGLVERDGDRYHNGGVANAFLSGGGPADLRPFLRFWDRLSYPTWLGFEETVRTGQGQSSMKLSAEQERIFLEGVEAIQAAPASALPGAYDFGGHQRILDLGGGTGSWLVAVLQRYPQLQGTLFDLPQAAGVARPRLAEDPAATRAEVVEGDFFRDPIPDGHDVVLIANVMHLFSPEHNVELLRRTRERVPDRARLLLADFWTDPTHTDPPLAALMAGEFLVITGEGDVYSEQETSAWLAQTGWQALERVPLAGPISLVVAEAGQ